MQPQQHDHDPNNDHPHQSHGNRCPYCGESTLEQNDQSHIYCTNCNRVLQGMNFAQSVTFGANQKMDGQVIDVNEKSNAYASEKRLKKARLRMESLRDALKIDLDGDTALEAGMRVINYANSLNFFDKGKNIEIYAAAAFYMTLRFIKQPYLLVDFSDRMNINLFKLARSFLKLLRFLGFQNQLPLIDPSIYIHRYCKMLPLGNKTKAIALTAIKLVQRMRRDWMCQGRRPSSLCGAAILIATKIHDVSISTNDICNTVFVCDETIRRRLEEFKQTSVAKMTKEEFERMEYEGETEKGAKEEKKQRTEKKEQIHQEAADDNKKEKAENSEHKINESSAISGNQQQNKQEDQLQHIYLYQDSSDQMDPPAFKKARQKSQQQQLRRRLMQQMQANPYNRDKLAQKIPWEKYKQTLNIPQEYMNKQVKGVEKELREARERYEGGLQGGDGLFRGGVNGEENMSNFTEENENDDDIFDGLDSGLLGLGDVQEEDELYGNFLMGGVEDGDEDKDQLNNPSKREKKSDGNDSEYKKAVIQKEDNFQKQHENKNSIVGSNENSSFLNTHKQSVSKKEDTLSDIDEDEIEKFLLDEDERRMKKNLWIQHNQAWLEKEAAKKQNEEKMGSMVKGKNTNGNRHKNAVIGDEGEGNKLQEKQRNSSTATGKPQQRLNHNTENMSLMESIVEQTKLGSNSMINQEELKRLINSEPLKNVDQYKNAKDNSSADDGGKPAAGGKTNNSGGGKKKGKSAVAVDVGNGVKLSKMFNPFQYEFNQ